jgi:S-adenosylmethionine synthetase
MARYIAKNIVAADIAERCLIQIAYAIGRTKPVSLYINTYGTSKISDMEIEKSLEDVFDLSPQGIINKLQLNKPIYSKTTNFGHFGRELPYFNWEKTDKVGDLKNRFNI